MENTTCRVILKKGRSKSVQNRHPWIFSGAIEAISGKYEHGDLVSVASADGKFLAKGFLNPKSQIRLRLLTFAEETITPEFFRKRISTAAKLRKQMVKGDTNAYRLIHSDGDFLPGLIVDRYADALAVQFNSLGMVRLKSEIVEILKELFSPEIIVERNHSRALKEEGLPAVKEVLHGTVDGNIDIVENGIKFQVDLLEGQKTGFFLDQRENRQLIGELAAGKKLLNCFAYSGGFSIYAALQKAETTSQDISGDALKLARTNFALNKLDPEKHEFSGGTAFDYLRALKKNEFEVIVLDPPAFVKNKQAVNRGARGYKDINRVAIQKIKSGGLLLTCSCSAYVNWDLFQKIVFSAAQEAGRQVQIIARPGQPGDHPINIYHPEGEYLKTLLLRIWD